MFKIFRIKIFIQNSKFKIQNSENGFGLVEIIIVTAIITTALVGFLQAETVAVRLLRVERENLEANLLAQEGLEAVRSLRDESWDNIATTTSGSTYYPIVQNGKWFLATSSQPLINGKYNRTVILNNVYRDLQDKISSSGSIDSGTRKITSRVTWGSKQIELAAYITDFQDFLKIKTESKAFSFEDAPTDTNLASFPSNNAGDGDPAQSFTSTSSAVSISKVELFLRRTTASPSDVYVELRSAPTGQILGTSATIDASTISSSTLSWIEFRFPDAVQISASTKYYIRLRSLPSSNDSGSGSQGTVDWGYRQTASSPYAGGEATRYIGRLSNSNDTGQSLDQYDYGFKVYMEN